MDRFFDREVNLPLNFDTTELKPDSLKEVLSTLKSSFDSFERSEKKIDCTEGMSTDFGQLSIDKTLMYQNNV